MPDRPAPSLTPVRALPAAVVLAAVVGLTLAPRTIARPARDLVLEALASLPPAWTALLLGGDADAALNVVFFVPLGAAVALLLPLRWSPASAPLGATVSLAVETVQTVLPGRVPDLGDVAMNSLGALLGTVLVVFARVVAGR